MSREDDFAIINVNGADLPKALPICYANYPTELGVSEGEQAANGRRQGVIGMTGFRDVTVLHRPGAGNLSAGRW